MARQKSAIIQVRVRPEIKEAAEEMAEEENRTLANFVECLIIERMKLREERKS